jgi:hypothetical protein
MFDAATNFGQVAIFLIGGALMFILAGGSIWPPLLGVGIALWFTLGFYNGLERRDREDAGKRR